MLEGILAFYDPVDHPLIEAAFKQHFGVMQRVANRYLGNEQDAADCVMEVFVKLADYMDKFRAGNELQRKYYLIAASRNTAINMLNNRNKRATLESSLDDEETPVWVTVDLEVDLVQSIIEQEDRTRLKELLNKLDPKYKDVLYARAFLGLKSKEIAELYGMPEATVNTRIKRAREFLIRSYKEEIDDIRRK